MERKGDFKAGILKGFLTLVAPALLVASCGQPAPKVAPPKKEEKKPKVTKAQPKPQAKPVAKVVEKAEAQKVAPPPEGAVSLSAFKHTDHMSFIRENGCMPCHEFNAEMRIQDGTVARNISKTFLYPDRAACLECHKAVVK